MNDRLPAFGRRPGDILFFQGLSFVIGSTDEEAQRKAREMEEWVNLDALSTHVGRDPRVDFARPDPDQPVRELDIQGLQGLTKFVEEANPGKLVRLRNLSTAMSYNGRIMGSPETIADRLEDWRAAGIEGVNIAYQTLPGSFADFAQQIMPVLRRRGLAQTDYAPGTLREKLFSGRGPRLAVRHPALHHRPLPAAVRSLTAPQVRRERTGGVAPHRPGKGAASDVVGPIAPVLTPFGIAGQEMRRHPGREKDLLRTFRAITAQDPRIPPRIAEPRAHLRP